MSDQLVTPVMYITSTNQINKFVGQVPLAVFSLSIQVRAITNILEIHNPRMLDIITGYLPYTYFCRKLYLGFIE